jgi:hypothetical protein
MPDDTKDSLFVEIVSGGFNTRGTIVPLSSLSQYVTEARLRGMDFYRSYYLYDSSIIDHVKSTGSMSGFTGKRYLWYILFDIDRGDRTGEAVLQETRSFVNELQSEFGIPKEDIIPMFSGNGFHVGIPNLFRFTDGPGLPKELQLTLGRLFPEADNIFDPTRVIRVEGTKNPKTGLYKITLTHAELETLAIEEIMRKAERPDQRIHINWDPHSSLDLSSRKADPPIERMSVATDYTAIVTCMQKLHATEATSGSRHSSILRMASAFRRGGLPKAATEILMQNWAKGLPSSEISKLVDSVYKAGYSYSCNDPVMAKYCDSKCIYFKQKNYAPDVLSAHDMEKKLRSFLEKDLSSVSIDLSDFYPRIPEHSIYPGEFNVVWGDTGINKTAWIQNICVFSPHLKTLFLSLEVNPNLIYRRFLQIACNMTKEEVWSHYRQNGETLADSIGHIRVIAIAPMLDDMEKIIGVLSPQVVVVDTVDCLRAPGFADPIDEIGRRLKEIAQKLDVIIFGIHHISKAAAVDWKTGQPKMLTVHSGKGSSTLEQKADKVYGLEGVQTGHYRTLRVLKARDEGHFTIQLKVDIKTLRFSV